MLHLSLCLQVTALIYLNRSGRKFSIVDPKEWLVDKVDILRVLAQPSLDNRVGYDFGELELSRPSFQCHHAKMPLQYSTSNIMAQLNAGNVTRHRIQHYHENDIYVIYTKLFINR